MTDFLFSIFASCFAFAYLYFIHREISVWRSAFKTLPVSILAIASFVLAQPLLGFALTLCAIGDLFLSRRKEDWFLAGLVSFLLGHVVYVILFARTVNFESFNWLSIGAMVLYALIFGTILIQRTEKYRGAIIAYICILTTMGVFALHLPDPLYAKFGAIIFIVSDSLLALRMFVVKEESVKKTLSLGVWCTYFVAQYLIFYGFNTIT